jgi:hypothetical protein
MSHIEQGNYGTKHSGDAKADDSIRTAIEKRLDDSHFSCGAAESISKELSVSMEAVGEVADLMEVKIDKCQLGLFGYTRTKGTKRIMEPMENVDEALSTAIKGALQDGRLSCASAWEIAKELKVSRMDVCSAADAMEIKSSVCQLGTF